VQLSLYAIVQNLLLSRIAWMARNIGLREIGPMPQRFQRAADALWRDLRSVLPEALNETMSVRAQAMVEQGIPQALAQRLAALPALLAAPDIELVATDTGAAFGAVARCYFALDARLGLDVLMARIGEVPVNDVWDRQALDRARHAIEAAHRLITARVVQDGQGKGEGLDDPLAVWLKQHEPQVRRIVDMMAELPATGLGVSRFSVTAALLSDLARGTVS